MKSVKSKSKSSEHPYSRGPFPSDWFPLPSHSLQVLNGPQRSSKTVWPTGPSGPLPLHWTTAPRVAPRGTILGPF